jgi:hypothetical protein
VGVASGYIAAVHGHGANVHEPAKKHLTRPGPIRRILTPFEAAAASAQVLAAAPTLAASAPSRLPAGARDPGGVTVARRGTTASLSCQRPGGGPPRPGPAAARPGIPGHAGQGKPRDPA